MTINLTKNQIDAALAKVAKGPQQYVWLQTKRDAGDLRSDLSFSEELDARAKGFCKAPWSANDQNELHSK
jgi:hypothetical protein